MRTWTSMQVCPSNIWTNTIRTWWTDHQMYLRELSPEAREITEDIPAPEALKEHVTEAQLDLVKKLQKLLSPTLGEPVPLPSQTVIVKSYFVSCLIINHFHSLINCFSIYGWLVPSPDFLQSTTEYFPSPTDFFPSSVDSVPSSTDFCSTPTELCYINNWFCSITIWFCSVTN